MSPIEQLVWAQANPLTARLVKSSLRPTLRLSRRFARFLVVSEDDEFDMPQVIFSGVYRLNSDSVNVSSLAVNG